MTANDQILHLAKCLAKAESRLRLLEGQSHPKHAEINRLEAQVVAMRKELDHAHTRVAEASRHEFSAKQSELSAALGAGLDRVKRELAENLRGLNPRGEWEQGMTLNRNDVVTVNGTSYVCLRDGVKDKPNAKDQKTFQVLARRGGAGGFNGTAPGKVDVPASASASGQVGDFSYDAQYYYICVATNTWLRTSIATW